MIYNTQIYLSIDKNSMSTTENMENKGKHRENLKITHIATLQP